MQKNRSDSFGAWRGFITYLVLAVVVFVATVVVVNLKARDMVVYQSNTIRSQNH